MGQMFSVDGTNREVQLMPMKEKPASRKDKEDLEIDVLLGARKLVKPLRPVGRLPQLNKRAKRLGRNFS